MRLWLPKIMVAKKDSTVYDYGIGLLLMCLGCLILANRNPPYKPMLG